MCALQRTHIRATRAQYRTTTDLLSRRLGQVLHSIELRITHVRHHSDVIERQASNKLLPYEKRPHTHKPICAVAQMPAQIRRRESRQVP